MTERRATSTSSFGVGRREGHDASAFYARFQRPQLSEDDEIPAPRAVAEPFVCADARRMDEVDDRSVALVVTSPPYFAGKAYEQETDRDGVPGSYLEYLELLRQVFSECKAKLEPGGRLAVNVANLGRKPYRSLSSDVMRILQDDLGLLLRAEVIWRKGEGASGSCAWGSFRSASNPVVRDVTERVVIASKGRFDRAASARRRQALGLPYQSTLTSDEFMAATLDVWDMAPESARRVRHPAPFPVELPQRLILLYTFRDDLVVDPFMGSGSTLVAAARTGRRYLGYDLDPAYVEMARRRVEAEAGPGGGEDHEAEAEALATGKAVADVAREVLEAAGFSAVRRNARLPALGLTVDLVAEDRHGVRWYFDVTGGFTVTRGGLARAETVWRSLGRAHVMARNGRGPLVLLTSHLPRPGSEADAALRGAGPEAFLDAVGMLSAAGRQRLARYAEGGHQDAPVDGFWAPAELGRRPPRPAAPPEAGRGWAREAAPGR